MPRFFIDEELDNIKEHKICGADARHIALSLRMKVGDSLTLCDGRGREALCRISSLLSECITLDIAQCKASESEMPCRVTLYQALAKGDKMETVVQKAVELGVFRIVPVESRFCIAKMSDDSQGKKLERWQKISREAAGQSQRGIVPEICPKLTFKEMIQKMKESELSFICYENEENLTLKDALKGNRIPGEISFFIGPEGGIAPEEIALARENGINICSLGKRILRTETASAYVLSSISCLFEL